MDAPRPRHWRFGAFELQAEHRQLLRDGQPLPIGPRGLDILCALAAREGRPASKGELMNEVWGERDVEEANLHVQVSKLRRRLGADVVVTVAGQGYRLGPAVQRLAAGASARPRPLSVIVLPFIEPEAPREQAYFADALTEDITIQLARIRGSFVIGTPTAMALRGSPHDRLMQARELGVRWALQGRIERGSDEIELAVRLSDTASGVVVWAELIRAAQAQGRQLRREVVERLARALDLELLHAEAHRARALSADEMQAADYVMQARAIGGRNWSREHYEQALVLYERALERWPDDAEALARRAQARLGLAMSWPGPEVDAVLAQAEADIGRALAGDSLDPLPYLALSQLRQQQYRLDEAEVAADQALDLNPSDVYALSWRGELHKFQGRPAQAVAPLERCLELSPRDPHRWVAQSRLGGAWLLAGDAARALPLLEQSHRLHAHWGTAMLLIASRVHLGQLDAARAFGREHYGAATAAYGRFNRISCNPVFLRQFRERVFEPLVRCGLRPDLAFADAWQARQLGRGQAQPAAGQSS